MVEKKKKTTNKKTVPAKKAEATKTTAKKAVPVKTVKKVEPKKVEEITKAVPATQSQPAKPEKKVYEVSGLFMLVFTCFIIIAYVQIVGIIYLYNNFEIYIRSNESIKRERILEQKRKQRMAAQQKRRAGQPRSARRGRNRVKTLEATIKENNVKAEVKVVVPEEKKPAPKTATCPPLKLEPRKVEFIEAEYAPYAGEGHAVIEGAACFELADGTTKCFENADVFINPVTTYSDEWYSRHWVGNERLAPADERAVAYNKMIKTGKDGKFKFDKLKPGSYYVGFTFCMPEGKEVKKCTCSRYASKVKMKNLVRTTLKKVYPEVK